MWQVVEACSSELVRHQNRFVRLTNLSRRDQIEALSEEFQICHNWMQNQAKKTVKLEKKLKVTLGGYMGIQSALQTKIDTLRKDQDRLLIERKTFQRLEENELKAIYKRRTILTSELKEQEEREKVLQKRFGQLQHRQWELGQMEDREKATTSVEPMVYEKT
uniref:Uncharacterized protein n=1 Tax=Ditylenchus dipsaci TaxID=166011 RepID=A0A915E201_9BILA